MGISEILLCVVFAFIVYVAITYCIVENKKSEQSEFDREVVERIIVIIKERQDEFKANWYSRKCIENSVNLNNEYFIHKEGGIISPLMPKMTKSQKAQVRELIKPIFRRAKLEILNNLK